LKYDCLILVSRPPLSAQLRESIDLAFAYASFDKTIAVVFSDDALWALNEEQKVAGQAPIYSRIKMFQMYDIEDVFALNPPPHLNTSFAAIDNNELIALQQQARDFICL